MKREQLNSKAMCTQCHFHKGFVLFHDPEVVANKKKTLAKTTPCAHSLSHYFLNSAICYIVLVKIGPFLVFVYIARHSLQQFQPGSVRRKQSYENFRPGSEDPRLIN